MKEIIEFAPAIIAAIMFFIQYKLFMTPADFEREKADFMKYIAENYVSDKTYRDNHKSLEDRIENIDKNVNDVKTLLISIVRGQNSQN